MISVDEIIHVHSLLIAQFGGIGGIRDKGLLQAALSRPFATFDDKELYPSAVEKAAAILESIIKNHPFFDGNKRVGFAVFKMYLLSQKIHLAASENELYDFIFQIAESKLDFNEIKLWVVNHIRLETK